MQKEKLADKKFEIVLVVELSKIRNGVVFGLERKIKILRLS